MMGWKHAFLSIWKCCVRMGESEREREVLLCGTQFCCYCWFSLTQLGQKHIKGNAKHSCSRAVSLLPWQDYSGEYLFWGAGHANCRPRCMQGEREREREREREQPLMPKATCFCFNNVLFSKRVWGVGLTQERNA